MQRGPTTPKGFGDFPPKLAKQRREMVNTIAIILEKYDFSPIETPTIEFAETLLGKYGEEEKLVYQFTDRGGRKLALRYDLTVPLARFVANNLGLVNPTFSRYQIGQVFRGEKPQKGRSREFTQFDFDIVGSKKAQEDAKIIAASMKGVRAVGFDSAKMAVNDRENFKGMEAEDIRAVDKIHKNGKDSLRPEILEKIENTKPTKNLLEIFEILENKYGLKKDKDFFFDPTLARGLDYYTGTIFEMKPFGALKDISIVGGGRYDNLIGMFAGKDIPAVGASFGIDRMVELLE